MFRKPTAKELKEARGQEPVYKVVREEEKKLKSLWVTGTKKNPTWICGADAAYELTYKENRLVANGKYGIWCCRTTRGAQGQASCNGLGKLCRIYKVMPIGNPITPPSGWGNEGIVLYPAIIMGDYIETIDTRPTVEL